MTAADSTVGSTSAARAVAERPPVSWKTIRITVGVIYLATQVGALIIGPYSLQSSAVLATASSVAIGIASAWLACRAALTFGARQTARWVWILIALMPLSDSLTYLAYSMPAYTFSHIKSVPFVGIATSMLSLTRILAAVAFLSMVGVYRKSGLKLNLRPQDYLAMVWVTLLEVLTLVYAGSGAEALGEAATAKLVLITSIPLVLALVPCTILGVIIWRYAAEMGGGLVAKAWRSTLLYGVGWLSYTAFHAIVAYHLNYASNKLVVPAAVAFLLVVGADWCLLGATYLIFLGASYQYEACTAAPDFSDEMNAFAAEA